MEMESITCFQYRLRNLACDGDILELLKALNERCGGQWVYSVRQDYEVYPDTPELSEAFFYPEWWKRGPVKAAFPGIQEFSWEGGSSFHFIHSSMTLGGEVRHLLQIRGEEEFTEEDHVLLDYACLLSWYTRDLPAASEGISAIMRQSYEGIRPLAVPDGVFPEDGYGIVLLERGDKGILKQQGYLGYRLHRSFRKSLRYCFLDETHLLLFVSTDNVMKVTEQLEGIIGIGDDDMIMGISGRSRESEMDQALGEARHAAEVGNLTDTDRRVFFHSELGIFRILEYPKPGSPVNRILEQMTDKLMEYPKEKRDALSDTMCCFVQNHFNFQKTADAMYAHVNTIRYRISLMENLWGCDLQREEDRLLFEVVSRLLPLWMKETGYE